MSSQRMKGIARTGPRRQVFRLESIYHMTEVAFGNHVRFRNGT